MTASGVGKLIFIDQIISKYVYLDILKENLNQSAAVLNVSGYYDFQQDNASKHKSYLVREWLYNTPHELESPQSLDVNLIEHLWQKLKLREWLYNTPHELESPQSLDVNLIEHLWQKLKLVAKQHKISNKNDLKNGFIGGMANNKSKYLLWSG
ncbi:hypothetical protein QE152_g30919 [Popillia japonica]|uniref:Transposase n=1 Tax=Popillia japonica TaxID=7064 RepID=A0AAW1JCH0_POPJA